MNKYVNNPIPTQSRRLLVTLALATTFALAALVGQAAVGKVLGVDLMPTVYACQSQAGGC